LAAPAPGVGVRTTAVAAPRMAAPNVAAPNVVPEQMSFFGDERPVPADIVVRGVEDVAYSLRRSGQAGARIAVLGATLGLEIGSTAIALARALAQGGARVVLVGLDAGDAAIKAASNDPSAAGLMELVDGTASFGAIITKDRFSSLNLIASGRRPTDRVVLLSAPGLATSFAALARSYDHVVVDAGAVGGPEMEAVGEIAPHAMLVVEAPGHGATVSAHDNLLDAGFDEVTVLAAARSGAASRRAVAAA
jgi:Mrp family chromosome partitioning ATPase